MPASAITCLAKDFEPSILAAAASGPKHGMRASRRASAAPATSGASGPMTTRPGASLRASARMPSGVGVVAARIEGADQGVLAPARPDDEYAHARSLPARQPVPLLGEHREVDLGAPLALEELVVHQPGLLPHAQPPGQLHRWLVAL